jgi:hypothetical protein
MRYLILILLALSSCSTPDTCLNGYTAILDGEARTCPGLHGCSEESGEVACSTHKAAEGQRCDDHGRLWCGRDRVVICAPEGDGLIWKMVIPCGDCSTTPPLRCEW